MATERYHRQQILAGIGPAGQARLGAARVLVVGAGGLGCPALLYLAGAGVGTLVIADHDLVSQSNLHRQILFTEHDLGQPKALCAALRLGALNPDIILEPVVERLNPANIEVLLAGVDVVVDAADSLALTYQLNRACFARNIPLITASALEQAGYIGGFCGGAPSYRAVFPDMPDHVGSCAINGVLGPVVGVLGSLQAQWVIQVLLGHQPSPLGQLFRLDLQTMRSSMFRFDGAPEPDAPDLPYVTPAMIRDDDYVIELRPVTEAPDPVHPAARRILPEQIAACALPKTGRIVLCCRSGVRAHRAGRVLQARGFADLALISVF